MLSAGPDSFRPHLARRIRHQPFQRVHTALQSDLLTFRAGHTAFDNHIRFEVQYAASISRNGISSSRPIRDGSDFRNQM